MAKKTFGAKKKMAVMAVAVVILFCTLGVRLAAIAIGEHERYADLAINQQVKDRTVQPGRGAIYDRNMNVMAESAACWTVTLAPIEISPEHYEAVATKLSEVLGLEYDDIYAKLPEKTYYAEVKRKVDEPSVKAIREFMAEQGVSGIHFTEDTKRYYPNGSMASHILGFVGTDNYGLAGLEAYYDSELSGSPGRIITAENARNFEMYYDDRVEYQAKPGYSIVTTMDKVAQYYLESALKNAVREHSVQNNATGILMDVNTGAVIAMATVGEGGSYDPNDPLALVDPKIADALAIMTNEEEKTKLIYEAQIKQWTNKAVTDLYEPGSVFKSVTAATALETNASTLDDSYYCAGSFQVTPDTTMYCAITAHGHESFADCLINSCNPGFIQIGQQIGSQRFSSYFRGFGLTEPTGIDLPAEAQSIFYDADGMGIVELASSSYGQSNSITPIQMITAFSAVVNGGYLVRPHLVERVVDSEGNTVESFGNPVKRQVISGETSAEVRNILEQIITPQNSAYVSGQRIGGKSGTAEKLSAQAVSEDGLRTFIASFCVFAPADDPQYALLIMLDEAQSYTIYGTTLVGPVCAKVMSDVLPYLGIDPTYTEEELSRTDVGVPTLNGSLLSVAYSELQKKGLEYEVIGEGTSVTLSTPQAGFAVPRGSKVYLYTDPLPVEQYVTVPDVAGESMESAAAILKDAGLNIRFEGTTEGWVLANYQSAEPDTELAAGTVVSVSFIAYSATD